MFPFGSVGDPFAPGRQDAAPADGVLLVAAAGKPVVLNALRYPSGYSSVMAISAGGFLRNLLHSRTLVRTSPWPPPSQRVQSSIPVVVRMRSGWHVDHEANLMTGSVIPARPRSCIAGWRKRRRIPLRA